LISNLKKVFLKAPLRISKYKEMYPVLLPPPKPGYHGGVNALCVNAVIKYVNPVIKYVNAVDFYSQHMNKISVIVDTFDEKEALSI